MDLNYIEFDDLALPSNSFWSSESTGFAASLIPQQTYAANRIFAVLFSASFNSQFFQRNAVHLGRAFCEWILEAQRMNEFAVMPVTVRKNFKPPLSISGFVSARFVCAFSSPFSLSVSLTHGRDLAHAGSSSSRFFPRSVARPKTCLKAIVLHSKRWKWVIGNRIGISLVNDWAR